jgi:hypothetical protein
VFVKVQEVSATGAIIDNASYLVLFISKRVICISWISLSHFHGSIGVKRTLGKEAQKERRSSRKGVEEVNLERSDSGRSS